MNFFNKKYLYFVLVFLGVFVLDYILFIWLFSQVFSQPPNDFFIGVTLMIGFFIIIPAVSSYYFVFKSKKSVPVEQVLNEKNRKPAIIITIILGLILTFLFTRFASVGFDPYTLEQVSESEFTKPLKIILTKKIGDTEYYLKEGEQNGVSLYEKVGENRADDRYLFDLPFDPKTVRDFWYDNKTNIVFAVEHRSSIKTGLQQIFKYSLNNQDGSRTETLKTTNTNFYSGPDIILDYFSESDTLLMETAGGDGCGGYGTIWTLRNSVSQTIQEFASGCAFKEKPRFVGYGNELLFFAMFDATQTPISSDFGLKEIFTINPRTKVRILISNTNLSENITSVKLSPDSQTIIMTNDKNQSFTLNLDQPSRVNDASPSANN